MTNINKQEQIQTIIVKSNWTVSKVFWTALLIVIGVPLFCILAFSIIGSFIIALDYMPWYITIFAIISSLSLMAGIFMLMMVIIRAFSKERKILCKKWGIRFGWCMALYVIAQIILTTMTAVGLNPLYQQAMQAQISNAYSVNTQNNVNKPKEEIVRQPKIQNTVFQEIEIPNTYGRTFFYKSNCQKDGKNIYFTATYENPPAANYRTLVYYTFFLSDGGDIEQIARKSSFQLMSSSLEPEKSPEFEIDLNTLDCSLAQGILESGDCDFNGWGQIICSAPKELPKVDVSNNPYRKQYDTSQIGSVVEF